MDELAAARRVPARQPGYFHLLVQMKVTKAKGLNTIRPVCMAARSGLWLPARSEPTCRSVTNLQSPRWTLRGFDAIRSSSAESCLQAFGRVVFEALFFGYFLLGQQKKVTRQPGRNPAGCRA